jgi:hypothetical protein
MGKSKAESRVQNVFAWRFNPSLHYSQKWKAEAFFRESEMQVDDVRIWLDRDTDSKVLSKVHDRILTRTETLRKVVNQGG